MDPIAVLGMSSEDLPRIDCSQMEQVQETMDLVVVFFCGDLGKTSAWFRAVNPMLGDVRPVDMIRWGRQGRLCNFVKLRVLTASEYAELGIGDAVPSGGAKPQEHLVPRSS